jgi:hypothetical protein
MNERLNKKLTPRQRHRRLACGMCGLAALLAVSIVVMAQDPRPRESRAHESVSPIFNDTPVAPVVVAGNERVEKRGVIEDDKPAAKGGERPGEKTILVVEGLEDGKLNVLMNKSAVLTTRGAYKRVSVGAPDIADVNPIGPANILVTAKKAGTTQMIVWDEYDRSQVFDVEVKVDLGALKEQQDRREHGQQPGRAQGTGTEPSGGGAGGAACRAVRPESAEFPGDFGRAAGDAAGALR